MKGDIINVDVTTYFNQFHGDTSATFYVGDVSDDARHVTEVARRALEVGISVVADGARIGDIGAAIEEYVDGQGCSVVREYVGHGIGRRFHTDPQVPHYRLPRSANNPRMRAGMVFTIEPMVNLGGWETELDPDDKWTVRTRDRSLSAQFEHTVLVTRRGCEVLTRRQRVLANSEGIDALLAEAM
jgi:methionyl aminopeptidase